MNCGDSRNSCNALYHYNKGEIKLAYSFCSVEVAEEIEPLLCFCCSTDTTEFIASCPLHRFAQMKNEVIQSMAFFILAKNTF